MLVTGGAGFIGANFIRHIADEYPHLTVVDKLTYAGNKKNLLPGVKFVRRDICSRRMSKLVKECDMVVNFAAESHVDRSIHGASVFLKTNVFGVHNLLELCRVNDKKFVQISTDEVYGSVNRSSKETDVLNPGNPYSASKASADMLVLSYVNTYGLDASITRSSNNYGPFQNTEKLIPKLITNAILNKKLPIYGDGKNVRDWIYVEDNCAAIAAVIEKGKKGEIYNIAGKQEKQNIFIAKKILDILGKPKTLIEFVEDRLGHDFRYSLDIGKVRKLGWKPAHKIEDGLKKTVEWYSQNREWW
jgi:dTDP-glucose 4,6-dehydratase